MGVSGRLVAVIIVLLFLLVSIPIVVKYKDQATGFLRSSNVKYCEETGIDQKQFTQTLKNLYEKDTKDTEKAYRYYSYSADCFEINELDLESDVKKSIFCGQSNNFLSNFPSEVVEKSKEYCQKAK
ncbi:hypothetical protein KY334_03755 [Candidatus Woesearchaeota archaeon]|nr:hypothetical protein [Candidatus Woesearchaeota archaeon]